MTIMVIVMGMTIVYEFILYLLQIILLAVKIDILPFLKIVGIEMLYNMMIVIIIYPIIQSLGKLIERVFKEKKTLTKYF